jgi:hypothetical protein
MRSCGRSGCASLGPAATSRLIFARLTTSASGGPVKRPGSGGRPSAPDRDAIRRGVAHLAEGPNDRPGTLRYRRLHALLRREAWVVNHKRVYRLHNTRRVYRSAASCLGASGPGAIGQASRRDDRAQRAWAMDHMSDALFDDRSFRLLTVVDCVRERGSQ